VSDSEEEEDASNMVNIMDLDEDNSRLSRFSGELDSHLSDSATFQVTLLFLLFFTGNPHFVCIMKCS
jgi:hypothetical protein